MASALKVRFSVTLDRSTHDRLVSLGQAQRPALKKQFLVELAVNRLLADIDSSQLELPLSGSGGRRGRKA